MPDHADAQLGHHLITVQRLKTLMTARATGKAGEGSEDEYQQLRNGLISSPIAKLLPLVVVSHRTLDEFYRFIQPEIRGYDERRKFVNEKFEPLLSYLEGTSPHPQMVEHVSANVQESSRMDMEKADPKVVFVVYGRNGVARGELFAFLRALHLRPLEWGHAVKLTGKSSPYVGEVLDAGFNAAQAIVVLLTPDDEARLRSPYQSSDEAPHETQLTGQPRQNVIFEAGMAMGKNPDRTIIVEMGKLRPMSDITGRHAIRLNASPESRNELANRLMTAGCDVDRTGHDWLSAGKFDKVLSALKELEGMPVIGHANSNELPGDLSLEEEGYLLDISRPRNEGAFSISYMRSMTGKETKYLEMMEHFVELGIMRMGQNVYSLTSTGRKVTDALWRRKILQGLASFRNEGCDFQELAKKVVLTDGDAESGELKRHLDALEDNEYVTVQTISLDGMLDIRISQSGRQSLKVV